MINDPGIQLAPKSLSAWLDFARVWRMSGKSPRTAEAYGEALARFGRYLGGAAGREVIDATVSDARGWIESLIESGLSDKSVAHCHASVRAVFSWWAREDITGSNPFRGIPQRQATLSLPEVLTDDELRALRATCERKHEKGSEAEFRRLRDAAILALWNEAGSPRASEMAALDLADVNLREDLITIRRGKGNKSRSIPLSPGTALAISRYLRVRDGYAARRRYTGTALWISAHGRVTRNLLGRMLATRCRQAGLPHVHPHQLRHTAYSRFEERGGLPGDAMALFGWSSDTMTRYYGASAAARRAAQRARTIALADL